MILTNEKEWVIINLINNFSKVFYYMKGRWENGKIF